MLFHGFSSVGIWSGSYIYKVAGVTVPICGNNGKWNFPLLPQIGTVITILGEMHFAVTSQLNTILAISLRRHFSFLSKRINQTRTTFAFILTLLLNHCFLSDSDTHFYIPIIIVKLYTDLCFTFARASCACMVAMLMSIYFWVEKMTPLSSKEPLLLPGDSKLHTVRIIRDILQIYWPTTALLIVICEFIKVRLGAGKIIPSLNQSLNIWEPGLCLGAVLKKIQPKSDMSGTKALSDFFGGEFFSWEPALWTLNSQVRVMLLRRSKKNHCCFHL